jgi:hypothetical protein
LNDPDAGTELQSVGRVESSAEATAPSVSETLVSEPSLPEAPLPEAPLKDRPPLPALNLSVAEAAPLATLPPPASPTATEAANPDAPSPVAASPFPRALLAELWRQIAAFDATSIKDWLPLLRLLALAVAAGLVLQLAGATLHAIDELPLMGGLLELVGLVSVLSFLARNALRQQKRAELLARIHKLRRDLLG